MLNMYKIEKKRLEREKRVFVDSKAYNIKASNSSKRPIEIVEDGLPFDKDASYYDMSGDKFLIIVNHYMFENTEYFGYYTPSTRHGTYNDEWRLKQVFYKLGFDIFVLRDLKYQVIIDILTSIATLDHSKTSCVCVTILTHGHKGGEVYAADRPYLLSEVMAIFENQPKLTNKPKLFFVQVSSRCFPSPLSVISKINLENIVRATKDETWHRLDLTCAVLDLKACRGDNMDAGHTVAFTSSSNSVVTTPPRYRRYSFPEEMLMLETGHTDAQYFGFCCSLLKVFRIFWMGGNADAVKSQSESVLTVPTHADTLVLCSTVEDYLSYRDEDGSWMIQALCDIIQNKHEDDHLLEMIILMNRTVAHDKTTYSDWKPMVDKKQMPETRFTLTKLLKFEAGPMGPAPNGYYRHNLHKTLTN